MARGINHIDLTVTDMARSRRFYEPLMKYLGYRITTDSPTDLVFAAADSRRGPTIAFHPAREGSRHKVHDRYAVGLHHLAFDAESRADVDAFHQLLLKKGVRVLDPPAVYYEPGYYAVFFLDPDGIKLEFAHTPGAH
jgi:glyoxylase I family protein